MTIKRITITLTTLLSVAAVGSSAMASSQTASPKPCPANDPVQVEARAAQFQMNTPVSLLSKCGLGGLLSPRFSLNFNLGDLINNLENKVCGLVHKSAEGVTNQINQGVGQVNQYGYDISNITQQAQQGNIGSLKNVSSVPVAHNTGGAGASVNVGSDSQDNLQKIYQNLFK